MNLLAYTRVSTRGQGESGLGLDAQTKAVTAWADAHGHTISAWHQDVASGGKRDRQSLQHAMASLQNREADGLVVAKLDRLSRSARDFADILDTAKRQGWTLVVLDLGMDLSTPMGEAMAGMASVFAQLERRIIGERTRAALEQAQERGQRLGRPRTLEDDTVLVIERLRRRDLSFQAVADRLNVLGVPTAHGGREWWPTTVRKAVAR